MPFTTPTARITLALILLGATALEAGNRSGFLKNSRTRIEDQKKKQAARDKLLDEDLPRHIREEREMREKMLRTLDDNAEALRALKQQVAESGRETSRKLDQIQAENRRTAASVESMRNGRGSGGGGGGSRKDSFDVGALENVDSEVSKLKRKLSSRDITVPDEERREYQDQHYELAEKVNSLTEQLSKEIEENPDMEGLDEKLATLQSAQGNLETMRDRLYPETGE